MPPILAPVPPPEPFTPPAWWGALPLFVQDVVLDYLRRAGAIAP